MQLQHGQQLLLMCFYLSPQQFPIKAAAAAASSAAAAASSVAAAELLSCLVAELLLCRLRNHTATSGCNIHRIAELLCKQRRCCDRKPSVMALKYTLYAQAASPIRV